MNFSADKAKQLRRTLAYIVNTGTVPLPVHVFDDDQEPIGELLRRDLTSAGLITIDDNAITLTADGHAEHKTNG